MTSVAVEPAALKSNFNALARGLTLVENGHPGGLKLVREITPDPAVPVIGFTGSPGAGKSSLVNALTSLLAAQGKRIAILAVDPTSPFNFGSLLGDRIRMAEHFLSPSVFIRSVATRGALGGLSVKTFEMADVLRAAGFDFIFIETVGVGQSEVDIAGLADHTILLLAPGAGDEVQLIKSGIMEIAHTISINKADLPGAAALQAAVTRLLPAGSGVAVIETAMTGKGLDLLAERIVNYSGPPNARKNFLLAERAWRLIQSRRMQDMDRVDFQRRVADAAGEPGFNVYRFADGF